MGKGRKDSLAIGECEGQSRANYWRTPGVRPHYSKVETTVEATPETAPEASANRGGFSK